MRANSVLAAGLSAAVMTTGFTDYGLDGISPEPVVPIEQLGLSEHALAAIDSTPPQQFRVYEFPVPGDYPRGRSGTWEGTLVFDDPTKNAIFETIEVETAPPDEPDIVERIELGLYVKHDSITHLLANEAGGVVGAASLTPQLASTSIDLDSDGAVDLVNTVDLGTGHEVFMVRASEAWALEELLAGRSLFCHPNLASQPGLDFANGLDPRGVSQVPCTNQPQSLHPVFSALINGGTLDDQCANHASGGRIDDFEGMVSGDLWDLGMELETMGANLIEKGRREGDRHLVLIGSFVLTAGQIVQDLDPDRPSGRNSDEPPQAEEPPPPPPPQEDERDESEGSTGDPTERSPVSPDGQGSISAGGWLAEMCERKHSNRAAGVYVYSVADLDAVTSPVDNQCDDPIVNPDPVADEPSTDTGRIRLCHSGEGDGEHPLVGNLAEVIGNAMNPTCDPSSTEEFCEPTLVSDRFDRGPSLAWGIHDIVGIEPCQDEVCNPVG